MTPKINLFFALLFFCGQQHLVPGIKYFRKSLGFVRYFLVASGCLDDILAHRILKIEENIWYEVGLRKFVHINFVPR